MSTCEQQAKFNVSKYDLVINPLAGPLADALADPLVSSLVGPLAVPSVPAEWGKKYDNLESATGRVNVHG